MTIQIAIYKLSSVALGSFGKSEKKCLDHLQQYSGPESSMHCNLVKNGSYLNDLKCTNKWSVWGLFKE